MTRRSILVEGAIDPALPDAVAIRSHTGQHALERGILLYRRGSVTPGAFDRGVASGVVQGDRGTSYRVRFTLEGGVLLDSSCECPMAWGCKHVAALALMLSVRPSDFGRTEGARSGADHAIPDPDLADPAALRAWAEEHGVTDLLATEVEQVTGIGSPWWAGPTSLRTVGELIDAEGAGGAQGYRGRQLSDTAWDLVLWLKESSLSRARAREYGARAEAWRSSPPPEPALQPLYHGLREWQAEAVDPFGGGLCGVPDLSGVELGVDPPELRLSPPRARQSVVPLQPGPEGLDALDSWGCGVVLDLLTHPELADDPLRQRVAIQAAIPRWQRTMNALDALLERSHGPDLDEADAEGRQVGWQLKEDGDGLQLQQVWCRPRQRGPGLRTWKATMDRADLRLASDRAAAAVLAERPDRWDVARRASCRNRGLAALVGHPRVVGSGGEPISVRRAELGLEWRPTLQGGVRVIVLAEGRPVEGEALAALVGSFADDLALHLDLDAGTCGVVEIAEPAVRLLETFLRRGGDFPPDARPALLERYEHIDGLVGTTLRGELLGTQVPGDARPLLRLAPSPDGSLQIEALSRPLPGRRPAPPGRGPAEVSTVVEGRRVYSARDLVGEPERFRSELGALGLPESPDFAWTLLDPEQSLDVVLAIQRLQERFQVEWARPAPTVTRPARADDLRVRSKKGRDWFGVQGGLDVEGVHVPLGDLLAAVRAGRRFVRAGSGAWVALTRALREQLELAAAIARSTQHGIELPPLSAFALEPVSAAGADVELPEAWQVQAERVREAAGLDPAVPSELCAQLRPYQVDGYHWLVRLAHWAPGAVLADDMGLGKTVQALALLLYRAAGGPALVVAPASVGLNWQREAERFAPSLDVRQYRGADRDRLLAEAGPGTVLVTSWELMTRDVEPLGGVRFRTLVFDEAQAIKNPQTRRARASAALSRDFAVALTGTPVENRVGEVWSLFRTVVPGLLGSMDHFRHRFAVPIEREEDERSRTALSGLLRPFLLRRLKSRVARDLPPRTESILRVELSRSERELYDRFRLAAAAELAQPKGESDGQAHMRILAALTRLRQLACHAGLVEKDAGHLSSAKLDCLVDLATDLRDAGHKALVFSQFTTLLGLARDALHVAGLTTRYLDGSTPVAVRQAEVDAFQKGSGDVFLISLKAGGTGLNLTQASYVIHLDPWWNPAVEDQATDRAHRIGQQQPVTVYRLVAADTIEDVVLAIHGDKRALVHDLLEGTGTAAALSPGELLALLSYGAGEEQAAGG